MHRALLAVAAVTALAACSASRAAPAPTPSGHVSAGDPRTAARFAPLVWLASGETYFEADTAQFIDDSTLVLGPSGVPSLTSVRHCPRRTFAVMTLAHAPDPTRLARGEYRAKVADDCSSPTRQVTSASDLTRTNETFALDLQDRPSLRVGSARGGVPVWWQYVAGKGESGAYVYWLFYAYDKFVSAGTTIPINHHEADWERVAVQVQDASPVAMTFWQHDEPACRVAWSAVAKTGGRPVSYSALGSHASYPTAGTHPTEHGGPPDDRTDAGTRWDTWNELRPADTAPWWGYRGWWGGLAQGVAGHVGHPGDHGIAGPSPGRDIDDALTTTTC